MRERERERGGEGVCAYTCVCVLARSHGRMSSFERLNAF